MITECGPNGGHPRGLKNFAVALVVANGFGSELSTLDLYGYRDEGQS